MQTEIARLVAHLCRIESGTRPGISKAELSSCEARTGVRLPAALADFYRATDGAFSNDPLLDIWPLNQVGRVPERVATFRGIPDFGPIVESLPDANQYFAFADSMAWSHVYATRLHASGEDAPVLWICGAEFVELAPSVGALWAMLLRDPEAVVLGQPA